MKTPEEMKAYLEQEIAAMQEYYNDAHKNYIDYSYSNPGLAKIYDTDALVFDGKKRELQNALNFLLEQA